MNGGAEPSIGARFVFERLIELSDVQSRWWAKGTGLGARLRLQELIELSEAQQGGDIYASSVEGLRKQAKSSLGEAHRFLGTRFGPLRNLLGEALSGSAKKSEEAGLGSLWPGSGAYSSLKAGLEFLDSRAYLEEIATAIDARAREAEDVDKLQKLNELVELLDAELVSEGHSRRWRLGVYTELASNIRENGKLKDALLEGLAQRKGEREFQVIGAIKRIEEPSQVEVHISQASDEELYQAIAAWQSEPPDEALDFPYGGLLETVSAVDAYAAAEAAAGVFGKRKALWVLQGGDLRLSEEFIVYDGSTKRVHIIPPDAPLNLRPGNLGRMRLRLAGTEERQNPPERLVDGLLQLAEARKSPPGAVLADLWGVAEVCFSGVAVGPRDQAGTVIAGIMQYLYITDYLDWLGKRFASVGAQPPIEDGQGRPDWALELIARHPGDLFAKLKKHDVLAWARAKQVARWDKDKFLEQDLEGIRTRVEATSARAYLMRNFYIHSGKADRNAALAVTLPSFAELLRLSLGFVMDAEGDQAAVSARLAMLRARQLAFDYGKRGVRGPEALADAMDLRLKQEP